MVESHFFRVQDPLPRVYFYHKSLWPRRRMSRFTSAELAKITWQHLRKLWSFKPPKPWCELEKKSPNSKYLRIALRSFGGFPEIPSNQPKKKVAASVTHHGMLADGNGISLASCAAVSSMSATFTTLINLKKNPPGWGGNPTQSQVM